MPDESPGEDLEFLDRGAYLEVRALGAYSLAGMIRQLDGAVEGCRTRKADRLLFNILDIRGYRPSTAERFQIGVHIADLIRSFSRFACLATRDQIDRENFTSRVASNRGQPAPVFNDRREALAWILEQPPPRT
jgi:hypothetical protein